MNYQQHCFRGIMSIGIGFPSDIKVFIMKAKSIISQTASSKFLYNATVTELVPESPAKGAAIHGATIRKQDGTFLDVRAKSTIIATGGFQGNSRLVSTHIGPGANDIFIRSNPYSTGDGYNLAQRVQRNTEYYYLTSCNHMCH